MRSASIGTPAASQSKRIDADGKRGGFTLLEALVALALILAFAAVLNPYLFQARKIMANADGRVAAQVLLRTLIDAPFDRSLLADASRDGEMHGLHWHIVTTPMAMETAPAGERPQWTAVRVVASVSLSGGQVITAETVRLAKSE
jgi:prepilin-type N-terminal cleavage/methylation domain-containing protein